MMLMTGSSPLSASQPTPSPSHSETRVMSGAKPKNAMTAMAAPAMPAANMLTSISKPALILPSHRLSSHFIVYADRGARIIAPMNMCTSPSWDSPSASVALKFATSRSDPAIAPIVAIEATTPPRMPYTMLPPV